MLRLFSGPHNFLSVFAGALALSSVAVGQPSISLIPGTVNAGGLNNTRFVSDLALTNPSLAPVTAFLTLVPANGSSSVDVILNPGQTIVYRNVLDSLWGAQGAGATQVIGTGPLLIRARTYNTAASGTYGVALPVFPFDRVLTSGDAADSLWISQSADGSSGFRTNVAVVFPDAGGGAATVSIYDADGNLAGTQNFKLSGAGFQQFSASSFAGAVPVGRAQIRVTSGRAAGYSVVVDNVTGDSSLFSFEALPPGAQDVVVNGVARANGRNNTFFRTDGRFYNPGTADATVSVAFHANQDSNPSPSIATFTVAAGKIRDVVDVLDSLLGLPIGSAGALRFKSDAPIAILCRTSNVDPLGIKPGTFGAQQKPVPLVSFLMSADAGAVVTAVRQNSTFRTNVGFAAGAEGAFYSLTLKNAAGAAVASATGSLGVFGWTQPNVQDLFKGATIPDDATLLVKVNSGSVDVFDSSIDNASGDPVVTPIMPLPETIPSAATIGPAGGSIRSSDGRLTLKVPAGVLAAPGVASFATAPSDAPNGSGAGYLLTLPHAVAGRGLLVLSYSSLETSGSGAEALSLAAKGSDGWYVMHGGSINTDAQTLTLPLLSVSPPSGSAARTRADTSDEVTLAVLLAWQIVPDKVVLPLKAKATFKAYYAGPPTTSWSPFNSNQAFFEKAASGANANVEWLVEHGENGASYGTLAKNGTSATYAAPCLLPPQNPIWVRYVISVPGSEAAADHRAKVFLLPRDWVGEVEVHQNWCGALGGGIYDYDRASIRFSLDDYLSIVDIVPGPAVAPRITPVASCPGDLCTHTQGPSSPDSLSLTGVTADSLAESYGNPTFSLVARYPLAPQANIEKCLPPGGTTEIPGRGVTEPIGIAIVGLSGPEFNITYPAVEGQLILYLRAVPDGGCPPD